jgi:hypothetical protein
VFAGLSARKLNGKGASHHVVLILMAMEMSGRPSDLVPDVLRMGSTDVRLGVLSMSARSPDGLDAEYLEWHALDHLPEQYRIPGIRSGQRWASTPACRAARVAGDARFEATDHVVLYLFADPVVPSLDTFFDLGAALGAAGRMPLRLPPVELGGYQLVGRSASPRIVAGADVLPWRPARGAYLLIERGGADNDLADLVDVPGVAGTWRFRGGRPYPRLADTTGLHLTVCYLDDDPVEVGGRIAKQLADRWASGRVVPMLGAPFEVVVPWAWDRSLPSG